MLTPPGRWRDADRLEALHAFIKKLALAALFLAFPATAYADSYRWIAIATGSTTEKVYAGLGNGDSPNEAITDAMNHCHNEGYPCSSLRAYNAGCLYAMVGNGPDGRAYLGYGPSYDSAKAQCEKSGGSCPSKKPIHYCAVPPADESSNPTPRQSVAPTFEAPRNAPDPDVSRGQPGYRPNEDEGPGDAGVAKPKIWLPAEDTATFTKARDKNSFTLCPTHDKGNRCFTFFNGDRPNRMVTENALNEAESRFKGGREGGAEDSGHEFFVLLNSLRNGTVRYQFADLARGTADGHYEGLFCAGYSGIKDLSPVWQYCGYVAEVRRYRTGE